MNEEKRIAISGVKWMTVSTFTTAIVAVLRLSVLTRFLDKADFGIVALLTFILGLTQTFADLGFSSAIMHKQDLSRKEFSSLYWIQLFIFTVLYVTISLFSPFIGRFYKELALNYLLPISLLDLIFYGIGRLYDTVLQKELKFKVIVFRNIVCSLLSLILAIILALMDFGIYSLVLSTLFQTLSNNVWNAIAGQRYYKLQLSISVKENIPLIKIGIYQTGTQIVDYFSSKFDVLIIGKLLGVELLGIYSLAKELVLKAILLLNSIVNKVILPFFAKMQNNNADLRRIYCQIIRLLSLVNFPASMLMFVLSTPLVTLFYGKDYLEAAPIVSILAIWSLFVCISNPVGNLAIAKGRTDISFQYTLIRLLVTVPIVYISSLFSLRIVACGQVLLSIIMFYIGYRMLIYKLIKLPLKNYLNSFGGIGIVTLLVGGIFYIITYLNLLGLRTSIAQISIYGFLLLTVYIGILGIFRKKWSINF